VDPTPERFRRLARSAPYRWSRLVLEGTWGPQVQPVRALVVQPDHVRVDPLDGRPEPPATGGLGPYVPPLPVPPAVDADGLVPASRRPWSDGPEVPFWQDYRFVAVLDPYELSAGVEVRDLVAVEHGGRPAWQAVLRPGPDYDPRCACCPLMQTRQTDLDEGRDPLPAYADAHLVRLDVGTGVCVLAREVGGPRDGQGHELVVVEAAP
jgi:hypothetical protein